MKVNLAEITAHRKFRIWLRTDVHCHRCHFGDLHHKVQLPAVSGNDASRFQTHSNHPFSTSTYFNLPLRNCHQKAIKIAIYSYISPRLTGILHCFYYGVGTDLKNSNDFIDMDIYVSGHVQGIFIIICDFFTQMLSYAHSVSSLVAGLLCVVPEYFEWRIRHYAHTNSSSPNLSQLEKPAISHKNPFKSK